MKNFIVSGWIALGLVLALNSLGRPIEDPAMTARGYYRSPAIHGTNLVFTAEGDLWMVGIEGGQARRLTSHPGDESSAAFSPDGKTLAFSAEYEGPVEVYTMPVEGGLPVRRTFDGESATVAGWTPDGKVLYTTRHFSTLPNWQLATIDLKTGQSSVLPLSQASDGTFDPEAKTLWFTRLAFQGSSTKRYQGGTAQALWKFPLNGDEAVPLTADFAGTSKSPMWWENRIYFITDRDGTMNIWSMDANGGDLRPHTKHKGWDVQSASLSEGRIVYQLGADLHQFEIAAGRDTIIPITLASDFDQEREKWVKRPLDYLTAAHLSTNGDRIVLTARGQVFVAPVGPGRFVSVTHNQSVRYRQARFLPGDDSLVALSDESGELEFEKWPANGIGEAERLTKDGKIFRFDGIPSPNGKRIVWQDKNQELWMYEVEKRKSKRIAVSTTGGFANLTWSPDSEWLAYAVDAENTYSQIFLHHLKEGTSTALTSDRVNSHSPAWSPDGKWIYFLSERHLQSLVGSPWGSREPEPYFADTVKIYAASLLKDGRSPFEPDNELHPGDKDKADKDKKKADASSDKKSDKTEKSTKTKKTTAKTDTKPGDGKTNKPPLVVIDLEGLQNRIFVVPVSAGNYSALAVNSKRLLWQSRNLGYSARNNLMTLEITNDDPKAKVVAEDIANYELSQDGKKVLIRKGNEFYVVDANSAPAKLEKAVDLQAWTFPLNPRDEWRQMFIESWRLMRDYFYDPDMHGVDWPAVREKYLPLVERVRDRRELNGVIADMVGELSALHTFVRGGDFRDGPDSVSVAGLGAAISLDAAKKGYRIDHIYRNDPDYPERMSPLSRPDVAMKEGDVIESINGTSVMAVTNPAALLRNQADRQVLMRVQPAKGSSKDVIVVPLTAARESDLRYEDWEYSRRIEVEKQGRGDIGYVHLRAMGSKDIADWTRDFYPVFNRQGLIIDVRHNGGGSIDSWILEKLLRKAWFYWKPRAGAPSWNMQYAFRGHVVVLCDERTGSDGEAFTEGVKRLNIGKVIGTRTWGGEIWLGFDNVLVDHGIASAAEMGVYGPEGKWLIEGHGVDPDVVVDNLPHAAFKGEDAQLEAAIKELREQIRLQPNPVPATPPHPNKSFK